ncbi:glyoxalase [Subtercola boreus]|uniref:Glyoxalase n=1 Tax=Subtercola boreus TaxID=120213 RepID=A0A3E0VFR2_9MICO|nr:VOC family protein [Subtercola boreus]RFA08499.1 glyoxalase [Subtercola boreus]TQL54578.1 catechol 2,3-dioxygenase-like lactoylglutathione lyase family enzyme [Subtercola boreus]
MFTTTGAFSGFSVDDIPAARRFYGETLGLTVTDNEMGFIELHLPSGGTVLAYPKPNHEPASYTMLNFPVENIDTAVDDLRSRGVDTNIYAGGGMPVDEKGIMRGNGPDIAWFRDPAGNVIAVIQV